MGCITKYKGLERYGDTEITKIKIYGDTIATAAITSIDVMAAVWFRCAIKFFGNCLAVTNYIPIFAIGIGYRCLSSSSVPYSYYY